MDRGSETKLQVAENLNFLAQCSKGQISQVTVLFSEASNVLKIATINLQFNCFFVFFINSSFDKTRKYTPVIVIVFVIET